MRPIDADEIRIKPEYMHDICGCMMIRVEDIARIINDMPTIEPQKWIPCSERLPDLDIYVLCTLNDQGEGNEVAMMCLTTSIRADDYYWTDYACEYSWELCEVFAWMPLPEPWKGEAHERK